MEDNRHDDQLAPINAILERVNGPHPWIQAQKNDVEPPKKRMLMDARRWSGPAIGKDQKPTTSVSRTLKHKVPAPRVVPTEQKTPISQDAEQKVPVASRSLKPMVSDPRALPVEPQSSESVPKPPMVSRILSSSENQIPKVSDPSALPVEQKTPRILPSLENRQEPISTPSRYSDQQKREPRILMSEIQNMKPVENTTTPSMIPMMYIAEKGRMYQKPMKSRVYIPKIPNQEKNPVVPEASEFCEVSDPVEVDTPQETPRRSEHQRILPTMARIPTRSEDPPKVPQLNLPKVSMLPKSWKAQIQKDRDQKALELKNLQEARTQDQKRRRVPVKSESRQKPSTSLPKSPEDQNKWDRVQKMLKDAEAESRDSTPAQGPKRRIRKDRIRKDRNQKTSELSSADRESKEHQLPVKPGSYVKIQKTPTPSRIHKSAEDQNRQPRIITPSKLENVKARQQPPSVRVVQKRPVSSEPDRKTASVVDRPRKAPGTSEPRQIESVTSDPCQKTPTMSDPHRKAPTTAEPYRKTAGTSDLRRKSPVTLDPQWTVPSTSEPHQKTPNTSEPHRQTLGASDPHRKTSTPLDPHTYTPSTMDPRRTTPTTADLHQKTPVTSDPHRKTQTPSDHNRKTPTFSDSHRMTPSTSDPHQKRPETSDPHQNTPSTSRSSITSEILKQKLNLDTPGNSTFWDMNIQLLSNRLSHVQKIEDQSSSSLAQKPPPPPRIPATSMDQSLVEEMARRIEKINGTSVDPSHLSVSEVVQRLRAKEQQKLLMMDLAPEPMPRALEQMSGAPEPMSKTSEPMPSTSEPTPGATMPRTLEPTPAALKLTPEALEPTPGAPKPISTTPVPRALEPMLLEPMPQTPEPMPKILEPTSLEPISVAPEPMNSSLEPTPVDTETIQLEIIYEDVPEPSEFCEVSDTSHEFSGYEDPELESSNPQLSLPGAPMLSEEDVKKMLISHLARTKLQLPQQKLPTFPTSLEDMYQILQSHESLILQNPELQTTDRGSEAGSKLDLDQLYKVMDQSTQALLASIQGGLYEYPGIPAVVPMSDPTIQVQHPPTPSEDPNLQPGIAPRPPEESIRTESDRRFLELLKGNEDSVQIGEMMKDLSQPMLQFVLSTPPDQWTMLLGSEEDLDPMIGEVDTSMDTSEDHQELLSRSEDPDPIMFEVDTLMDTSNEVPPTRSQESSWNPQRSIMMKLDTMMTPCRSKDIDLFCDEQLQDSPPAAEDTSSKNATFVDPTVSRRSEFESKKSRIQIQQIQAQPRIPEDQTLPAAPRILMNQKVEVDTSKPQGSEVQYQPTYSEVTRILMEVDLENSINAVAQNESGCSESWDPLGPPPDLLTRSHKPMTSHWSSEMQKHRKKGPKPKRLEDPAQKDRILALLPTVSELQAEPEKPKKKIVNLSKRHQYLPYLDLPRVDPTPDPTPEPEDTMEYQLMDQLNNLAKNIVMKKQLSDREMALISNLLLGLTPAIGRRNGMDGNLSARIMNILVKIDRHFDDYWPIYERICEPVGSREEVYWRITDDGWGEMEIGEDAELPLTPQQQATLSEKLQDAFKMTTRTTIELDQIVMEYGVTKQQLADLVQQPSIATDSEMAKLSMTVNPALSFFILWLLKTSDFTPQDKHVIFESFRNIYAPETNEIEKN